MSQIQIAILRLMNELAEKKNHALKWITTGGGTNNETGEGTGRHIQLDTTTGVITKGYGAGKSLKEAFAPKTERQKIGRKFSEAGAAKYGGSERDYRNLGVTKGQADSFAAEYLKSGNIPEGHLRDAVKTGNIDVDGKKYFIERDSESDWYTVYKPLENPVNGVDKVKLFSERHVGYQDNNGLANIIEGIRNKEDNNLVDYAIKEYFRALPESEKTDEIKQSEKRFNEKKRKRAA